MTGKLRQEGDLHAPDHRARKRARCSGRACCACAGAVSESGTVVRYISDPAFDIPTTIDRFGNRLYAVNARFTTAPTETTEYSIVRVRR